jgi:hypothetical protein
VPAAASVAPVRKRTFTISSGRERGAVSVELVATLPFLGLALLAAAQIALTGGALWATAISARAGARAVEIGREAGPAARRALPPPLREGARVSDRDGVEVRVRVPALLAGMPRLAVGARSSLRAEDASG